MAAGLDEVSRLLGRMEQELVTLRRENEILFRKLSDMDAKLDGHLKASAGFSDIIDTVNRHEAIVQRGAGITLALAAMATTIGIFTKDIVSWVMKKAGF